MAQSINIKIAGRPYNLTATSPEHEEVIRKAAEDVNRKIAQYQEKFPKTGLSDIMAFMALNVCMNNIVLQKQISTAFRKHEETGCFRSVESLQCGCPPGDRRPDLSAGIPGRWGAARPLLLRSGRGILSS